MKNTLGPAPAEVKGTNRPASALIAVRRVAAGLQELLDRFEVAAALDQEDRLTALERGGEPAQHPKLAPLDVDLDERRAKVEIVERNDLGHHLLHVEVRPAHAIAEPVVLIPVSVVKTPGTTCG